MISTYAKFIVHHSFLVLFMVTITCVILIIVPLVFHKFPSFTDPMIGFETRGTTLANRFIAWENLLDETRPSKRLAINPKDIEDQIRMNHTYNKTKQGRWRTKYGNNIKKQHKNKNIKLKFNLTDYEKYWNNTFKSKNNVSVHIHWGYGKNISDEDEDSKLVKNHIRKQWQSIKNLQTQPNKHFHRDTAVSCGSPIADYAHFVISTNNEESIFSEKSILDICKLQSLIVEVAEYEYHKLCERPVTSEDDCCPMWSVPNYIALMSNKNSCAFITSEDIDTTIMTLQRCAEYFHNFKLTASCDMNHCPVPKFCSEHDAVYNLLFYLIDSNGFSPSNYSQSCVKNTMIFLPLPSSSTTLSYYLKFQTSGSSFGNSLTISAIDFGLKNSLFDLWIIQDTWLVGLGGLFVFFCVWIYAKSILITLVLFMAIIFSVGISYFLYIYVFNLNFFPFMNLLVIVVIIGIGADDAFLYLKVWNIVKLQYLTVNAEGEVSISEIKNIASAPDNIQVHIVEDTLKHCTLTILLTSLTTAVAFFASYVSHIPAINCFSIFAGTTVVVNFFLMITWLPAAVFLIETKICTNKLKLLEMLYMPIHEMWHDMKLILNKIVLTCIIKFHLIFSLIFGAVGIYSIIVVFYYPGLQLPDSKHFQLFQTSHPFEQYDIKYKEKFLFERYNKDLGLGGTLPLRWVWGIKAIDNGNHMDPTSTGNLVFDDSFSISDPQSQVWLLGFCNRLKAQRFYQHILGPLLPNCFIEAFKMYMSRRCIDSIDKIDRSPCCESSQFPYRKEVFDLCIIKAMESLYQTPREFFMPGVAGPKFLRTESPLRVVALVVEFESVVPYSMSYTAMNDFFNLVENWTLQELQTAPPGMKSGWFLSELQFYDLQNTLASGTVIALILSAVLGFLVLLPGTLNIMISVCALITMIFACSITIAILVACGWKLNVLESIAISTSAGLSVDFSLHYALSYTNTRGSKSTRVKSALTSCIGPTVAAAVTTGCAGIFLIKSNLLPYSQIGIYLAIIMLVSWMYATFFLCSLLYLFGADMFKESSTDDRKSDSRVSSICSGLPHLETHELEHLADSNCTNPTETYDPSSLSAATVVLHDEFENLHAKIEKCFNLTEDDSMTLE